MSASTAVMPRFSARDASAMRTIAAALASSATTRAPVLAAARLRLPRPQPRSRTCPRTYGRTMLSNGLSAKSPAAICFLNCVSKNSTLRLHATLLRHAQPALDDLARRRELHLGDDHEALGKLVLRDLLREQVIGELGKRRLRGARLERDERAGLLAQHGIGHRHDRRLQDLRMRIEQRFDVGRIELDAAAVDHVLDAPGDRVVAVLELGEIAGAEPAVGAEGGAVRVV